MIVLVSICNFCGRLMCCWIHIDIRIHKYIIWVTVSTGGYVSSLYRSRERMCLHQERSSSWSAWLSIMHVTITLILLNGKTRCIITWQEYRCNFRYSNSKRENRNGKPFLSNSLPIHLISFESFLFTSKG